MFFLRIRRPPRSTRTDPSFPTRRSSELGLVASDIESRSSLRIILRMHRRLPEGYQVEDVLVSDCVLAESVAPKNLDGEVSEIRLVSIDELWSKIGRAHV